jgi:uncharacterized linocin/CFP29 family protein
MSETLRNLAPVSAAAWQQIDAEATRTLKAMLAGRRLVDVTGPRGWETSALGAGRVEALAEPPDKGVEASLRITTPLVEFRAPFELVRSELEAIARGAPDADLGAVGEVARAAALAEDRAIFRGYAPAGIRGICEVAAGSALKIGEDYERYPKLVADAMEALRSAGIDGPYGIALGPRCFTGLSQTATRGGFPVIEHVRGVLDGPIVRAPAVNGAVVLSLRGGDFELILGQDFTIGYLEHSATSVRLYLEESFTFRVLCPQAAVPLVYAS